MNKPQRDKFREGGERGRERDPRRRSRKEGQWEGINGQIVGYSRFSVSEKGGGSLTSLLNLGRRRRCEWDAQRTIWMRSRKIQKVQVVTHPCSAPPLACFSPSHSVSQHDRAHSRQGGLCVPSVPIQCSKGTVIDVVRDRVKSRERWKAWWTTLRHSRP